MEEYVGEAREINMIDHQDIQRMMGKEINSGVLR